MAFKSSPFTILLLVATVLLLLTPDVQARPKSIGKSRLDSRAAAPMTFTTKTTKTDSAGQVFTEACTITLTPITVNGQEQVQEVSSCMIAPGANAQIAPPPAAAAQTTGVATAATNSAATAATTSAAAAGTASASAATASSASIPQAAFSIIGDSSITRPASTSTAPAADSAAATTTAGTATSTASASAAASTTAAADNANSSSSASASASAAASSQTPTTQFSLPGKTISVLPIGLGVFAGISVIALVVVGLVTYERTKYRKAFRARKLAEAGGSMGYGGMAEARV